MAVAMGRLGAFGQPSNKLGRPRPQDAAVDLGEEQGHPQSLIGDPVAMALRDPFDESMQPQSAQIIGHPAG